MIKCFDFAYQRVSVADRCERAAHAVTVRCSLASVLQTRLADSADKALQILSLGAVNVDGMIEVGTE